MTNTEGFLFIILIIDIFCGLIGLCSLFACQYLLGRIGSLPGRLFLVIAGFGLNVYIAADMEAALVIATSAFVVLPLAALIPLMLREGDISGRWFSRILTCYGILWGISVTLPFLMVSYGLSMHPFVYWHTPLSTTLLLAGVFLVYVAVSAAAYKVMERVSPAGSLPEY